ncbi:Stf0 family sulfotransferase [Paracoccus cavernae]
MSFKTHLSRTGTHEENLKKRFGRAAYYDGTEIFETPLYCMGFTNRCGSNLLADYLRATPYFGGFHEQLNFDSVVKSSEQWGTTSLSEYMVSAGKTFGADRTSYGFKASADQLMMLQRFGIAGMYRGGMKVIHITREDLIGQAISYQIALQTRKWTSNQAGVGDDVVVQFDARQLTAIIDAIQADNSSIAMFAAAFGYPYLHVSYENLVEDPAPSSTRLPPSPEKTAAPGLSALPRSRSSHRRSTTNSARVTTITCAATFSESQTGRICARCGPST